MDRIIRQNTKARVNLTCPECNMKLTDSPNGGFVNNGDTYCCEGCANGTGCTCNMGVPVKKSFSRPGDVGWRNAEDNKRDNNFNAKVTASSRVIGKGRDKTKPRFKSRDSSHHDNSTEPRGKRLKSQNKPRDSSRQPARGQSEERGKLAKSVGRRQGSRGGDRVSRTASKGK